MLKEVLRDEMTEWMISVSCIGSNAFIGPCLT